MKEDYKRSIENFLTEEYRKRKVFAGDQETLRQWLQAEADKKIATYRQEWKESEPEAQNRFTDIVIPWWQDFRESGIYDGLIEWVRNSESETVRLSESIVYPWPRHVIKEFEDARQSQERKLYAYEPFEKDAEIIMKALNEGNVKEAEEHGTWAIPEDELWRARFFLTGGKWSSREGFFISRWPQRGANYAFATGSARDLEIPLIPDEEREWFDKIHPKVWLGLAEQIERGKTWEVLQESLKPKT